MRGGLPALPSEGVKGGSENTVGSTNERSLSSDHENSGGQHDVAIKLASRGTAGSDEGADGPGVPNNGRTSFPSTRTGYKIAPVNSADDVTVTLRT